MEHKQRTYIDNTESPKAAKNRSQTQGNSVQRS